MRCIAHRGFAETNPENTLTAVREAAKAGADLVEVDVRRCGSGELVLAHDADVDRISDTGADVLAVADEFGTDPLLSSFDPVALDAVGDSRSDADPETAYIFADSPVESIERAGDLGCVAVHPRAAVCTAAFVERAHDEGLVVNAWTVSDGATAARLRAAGVDGLIADSRAYCRQEPPDTDGCTRHSS